MLVDWYNPHFSDNAETAAQVDQGRRIRVTQNDIVRTLPFLDPLLIKLLIVDCHESAVFSILPELLLLVVAFLPSLFVRTELLMSDTSNWRAIGSGAGQLTWRSF